MNEKSALLVIDVQNGVVEKAFEKESVVERINLASLKGEAFDQFFLSSMIAHHEGALDMVYMIIDSTNEEVKTLAANIVTSQSAEIETMKALLK